MDNCLRLCCFLLSISLSFLSTLPCCVIWSCAFVILHVRKCAISAWLNWALPINISNQYWLKAEKQKLKSATDQLTVVWRMGSRLLKFAISWYGYDLHQGCKAASRGGRVAAGFYSNRAAADSAHLVRSSCSDWIHLMRWDEWSLVLLKWSEDLQPNGPFWKLFLWFKQFNLCLLENLVDEPNLN